MLISFGAVVERASIDEAYLDLTQLVESRSKRKKLYLAGDHSELSVSPVVKALSNGESIDEAYLNLTQLVESG